MPTATTSVPDAPQMRNLQTKLDAAQKQLDALNAQVTRSPGTKDDGGKVLSGSTSRLDYANLENQIAEKIYGGSLAALEQARPPVRGQAALPQRLHPAGRGGAIGISQALGSTCLLFALAAVAIWGVTLFGISLARHQLA